MIDRQQGVSPRLQHSCTDLSCKGLVGEDAGVTGIVAGEARGRIQPVGAEVDQGAGAPAGDGNQEEDREAEVGEPVPLPNLRVSPIHPGQDEIDRHNASGHIPRRLWCPTCCRASLEEDPRLHSGVDHRDDGIPLVCLD